MRKIVIGTRASKLAMVQTEMIAAKLKKLYPGLEISITKIVTAGDRDRQTQLDRIGVAVFVKELEDALLEKRIDLAVHSLKDVPTELPSCLCLIAVTERADPRDAIVARAKLEELPPHSKIGTDSLRRSVQIDNYRSDLDICGIRGNVDTRLNKVASGQYDGVVVAAAAMHRLGWEDRITQYLPLDHFLPAVGQGALAIEAREDDIEMAEILSPLNHLPTWQSVMAERAFLSALGGGCRAPIAALGTVSGDILTLEGMVASINSKKVLRFPEKGDAKSAEEVGRRLADRMLSMGASEFLAEVGK